MSDQPASLRFVHRFRSGTLGTLVIELVDHGNGRRGPGPLQYTWNGPRPPHGGERLKWALECQRIFADRFKVDFDYATADERGSVMFHFMPGERPKKISLVLPPGWQGLQSATHFNTQGEPYPPAP
jgi:hypothetical protein